jgi:hypothetical protein
LAADDRFVVPRRGESATGSGNPYCEYKPQLSLTDRAGSVAAEVDSCVCTNQL